MAGPRRPGSGPDDEPETLLQPGEEGGVSAAYTYSCVPDRDRTKVTLIADCRAGGIWRPFAGLLRAAIRRAGSGQLTALKRMIETSRAG